MTTDRAGQEIAPATSARPPLWLFAATGALTLIVLAMAVAETNLWMHYLIDGGEYISLVGLAFIAAAGVYLSRQQRVLVSLPLVFPWLLFPVITQGDQIIDNLSINPMRIVCHVLLATIFGTPVAVFVLAARCAVTPAAVNPNGVWLSLLPGLRPLAEGRIREGTTLLTVALLALEMWVAVRFLGMLMVVTLVVMILGALWYGSVSIDAAALQRRRQRTERFALGVVLVGVVISFGLYVGYKNRPGAYQGSPSSYMDPSQRGIGFNLENVAVPSTLPRAPRSPEAVRAALGAYGRTLEKLLAGYHVLDRNYTYDFHNELFMRRTPLVPNYREVGLSHVEAARQMKADADALATTARGTLADDDRLAALLDDARAYVTFNFNRAHLLEGMSGEFERTTAGLQHAAHLYEGEGKVLGVTLNDLLKKHELMFDAPATAPVTGEFRTIGRGIYDAYANRVVGF